MSAQRIVQVGVGAMIAERTGRFLVARRGPGARNEVGTWEFPGGGVEFGETTAAAVLREFREEYGLKVEIFGLLGAFDHILPAEGQHWVSITYLGCARDTAVSVREPEKCDAVEWRSLNDMPSPLSMISMDNLKAYRAFEAHGRFEDWAAG